MRSAETKLPYCPKCGSPACTPSTASAGLNDCLACRHRGPVADFHKPDNASLARKAANTNGPKRLPPCRYCGKELILSHVDLGYCNADCRSADNSEARPAYWWQDIDRF